jgi:microsomal epoxide hydrolase
MPITPFRIDVGDDVLADLVDRLNRTRYPNQVAGRDWDQGTDLVYLQQLVRYWVNEYDWRAHEANLNRLEQYTTEVDGQRIHFVHARSAQPDALPLLVSHGWPGSIVEFLDVIEPLRNPAGEGGSNADAFHVIAPSLPGYAFSGPTTQPGWHPRRIAQAYLHLMGELGYERFGLQGGDWGSIVTANMADLEPACTACLHLNFVAVARPREEDPGQLSPEEASTLAAMSEWRRTGAGYQEIQGTKPQTLGYSLEDSPAGLAAWIIEKFRAWSDCGGEIERSFTKDQLLTNITVYWVTGTATSSTRLYYEMRNAGATALPQQYVDVPTGIASYPGEVTKPPRRWVERRYRVTHWAELPRGGHFAAMEVPDLFVEDVRRFFRTVRSSNR